MSKTTTIYCTGCRHQVSARLTCGAEIYPHRADLATLPFWICDTCSNYVGCHHKTSDPTRPLGNIPTAEIRSARLRIHAVMDPLWQSGKISRRKLYRCLGTVVGREYHTAEVRSVEECHLVLNALLDLRTTLGSARTTSSPARRVGQEAISER